MSILGTRAGLFADLALILQIAGFVILCLGVISAKKGDFLKHFTAARVTVLLGVMTFLWMGPSLIRNFQALASHLTTLSSLLMIFHVIIGTLALLTGTFFAFDRLIKKTRNHMRTMFILWSAALFLGIVIYTIYYMS